MNKIYKIAKNTFLLQGGLALMSSVYGKYKEGKTIFEMLKINAARELNEEVGVSEEDALNNLHFIGLINDDKTEVGQVHVGVVYECKVDKQLVEVKEDDTLVIKWMTGEEAKSEKNYETWSEFLKPIF